MLSLFARRVAPRVVRQQRRLVQLQQKQRAAAFHSGGVLQQADEAPASADTEFKWQHLLTPHSPPEFASGMRAIEQQLATMRQELSGVPERIEPINWSEWEAKIEDKAAVERIRAGYDSFQPEPAKGLNLEALNKSVDARIKAMSAGQSLVTGMLAGWRQELEAAKREKEEVHHWKFHDYLARYPGLAEEVREEWMQGYQLPNDALERLAETDLRELSRQLKSGQPVQLEPDLPLKVGAVSYEDELNQVEQNARKLLGDQPELQQILDRIKREREMFKQADHH